MHESRKGPAVAQAAIGFKTQIQSCIPTTEERMNAAAIYARKSSDQNAVVDEAKSVQRQIDHATAYAARKGWTIADEHVYADDGVSGALFGAARPGLARLLNALAPMPAFQVLIMSEESRLGREATETAWALKLLY